MNRREFLASLAAAGVVAPGAARAQTGKVLHVGAISPAAPITADSPSGKILLGALAQHGYVLGRNLAFDARGAMGDAAKLPRLLDELRAAHAGVLIANGYPAVAAAKAIGIEPSPTLLALADEVIA